MVVHTTDLDGKNFDTFVKKGICVVDFWAVWCGPCKISEPIFEALASEFKGRVGFGKVDVDKNYELAQRFRVMSIPTMIFFKNGEQVDRVIGALPKDVLKKKIDTLL